MDMKKVVILGATGMLGTAVVKEFGDFPGEVLVSYRGTKPPTLPQGFKSIAFDASTDDIETTLSPQGKIDYVVNCIGIIKPYIDDSDYQQRLTAIRINGMFPYALSEWAEKNEAGVIQIATDCVFSGAVGGYLETDKHDALDVYGKSKSLGEVPRDSMMHLRVSIIGPESGRSTSLLEWVRNQPKNAKVSGFTDHVWNGITTNNFGKLARGIIETSLFRPGVFHVVPGDKVPKNLLVSMISRVFGREDIQVEPTESGNTVDRTLRTEFESFNKELWFAAGYSLPPTIEAMLEEIRP
jgi:dTDP-4-dehydrorhamnose reductase